MAAAMISERGLRKKLGQDVLPEKPPRKPAKRKSTATSSKTQDKRNEHNNNSKKPRIQTGDPKLDLFSTYQPWVIQTYGDLAKTKTITLKKYARIMRTLRGEECNSSDSSKFRFWVKAKGFHIGKPPGYEARPADGIVCRYSIMDAEGCSRGPDGQELYSGSQNDPPLYIPTPPLKVDNTLVEIPVSDDSDAVQDLSERKSPEKKPRKRRSSTRSSTPYVLNTPSPRPSTPFALSQSSTPTPFSMLTSPSVSTAAFLTPPVGIATPLTPNLATSLYPLPSKKRNGYDDSKNGETPSDMPQDLSQNGDFIAENEFEMFGKLIASQLRKLPLSLALDTQLKIQTLVNAARIQAVYQQYTYAGPSQETLSVQALSNGILASMASQSSAYASRAAIDLRHPNLELDLRQDNSLDSDMED